VSAKNSVSLNSRYCTTGPLSPLPDTPGCAAGKESSDERTPFVCLRCQSRNRTPNQFEKLMSYLFFIFMFYCMFFLFLWFLFLFSIFVFFLFLGCFIFIF